MSVLIDHKARFSQLDSLLTQYQAYWQLQAFSYLDLPWRKQAPELCLWLDELSQEQLLLYKAQPALLLQKLEPILPNISQLEGLSQLSHIQQSHDDKPIPKRFSNHIKGRKWQQIVAFEASTALGDAQTSLEWCAGKGHLGRLLSFKQGLKLTSVEWQKPLCEHGQHLANANHLTIDYVQADVLQGEADALLTQHDSVVALHACGELHMHLLRQAASAGTKQLIIAPCCYHLVPHAVYQPLSEQAKQSLLRLSRQDLKLPLQETVVAGLRVQRLRKIELSWRLAFDCLQRDIRNDDSYLNIPSIAKKLLSGRFQDFCLWAATEKNILLPDDCNFADYLKQGTLRLDLLNKIELIQHLFRAPLEHWLILDRALFLNEQAYDVDLGYFCQRNLSPRNIMIRAKK